MGPKLLAETADMIGIKELKDAFREVGGGVLVVTEVLLPRLLFRFFL